MPDRQCCFNAGPTSQTLAKHWHSIGQSSLDPWYVYTHVSTTATTRDVDHYMTWIVCFNPTLAKLDQRNLQRVLKYISWRSPRKLIPGGLRLRTLFRRGGFPQYWIFMSGQRRHILSKPDYHSGGEPTSSDVTDIPCIKVH